MKKLITTLTLVSLLSACSSMPNYQEMSCIDLKKKEKSLQIDYKINSVGAFINDVASISDNSTKATVDSIVANQDFESTKKELREVHSLIKQKRCKK